MSDTLDKKKDNILKTLAVAGFISIILLIAWISVQLVNIIPGTFSSLASLAEGINEYKKVTITEQEEIATFSVVSNATLINSGENVELSWDTIESVENFAFSYECFDGVSVDIINNSVVEKTYCDTEYDLGKTSNITLLINSEKERYADISYTISFSTNNSKKRVEAGAVITVINSDIGSITADNNNFDDTVESETKEEVEIIPEVDTTDTSEPEVSIPTTHIQEQEFVYTTPISNPNGYTDLSTKFLHTGVIVGNNFFAEDIKQNGSGAIQFEVKNYGTKTSDEWSYEITLPGGGVYVSPILDPLKPNERALLTLGFPTVNQPFHRFDMSINEDTDLNPINDKFSELVIIYK